MDQPVRTDAGSFTAAIPTAAPSPTSLSTPSPTATPAPKFVATGSMHVARMYATATLLLTGKVLIAGGYTDMGPISPILASAELYDPVTGRFSATGSMTAARGEHSATLLADGRVLVAGGKGTSGRGLSTAEIYDPGTGTFRRAGSMPGPLVDSPGTLLGDGRVLFAADYGMGILYDPKSGKFTALTPLPLLRDGATATLLRNGKVLFTGTSPLDDATQMETYDPTTGKFTSLAFTPPAGTAKSPKACEQALYYQPSPQTATLLSDGRVLMSVCSYLETYDPASAVFAPAGQISTLGDLNGPSATRLSDGRVLFSGGELVTATSSAQVASASIYDPADGPHAAASMTTPREYHTATLLPDGSVLIAGGTTDGTTAIALAELFK